MIESSNENQTNLNEIELKKHKELTWVECCNKCKTCCSDWDISGDRSEVICGYNSIKLIKSGKISCESMKGLRIVEIDEKNLDRYATILRMFPLTNLFRHMTKPDKNNKYHFLAIQSGKMGKCPFLTPNGCSNLEFKTYICDIFPFYVHKLKFHTDYNCPFVDQFEDQDLKIREKIGKYIIDYILEAEKHQDAYQKDLEEILSKYKLTIIKPNFD